MMFARLAYYACSLKRRLSWRQLNRIERAVSVGGGLCTIAGAFLAFHIYYNSPVEAPGPWQEEPYFGISGLTASVQYVLALNGLYIGIPDGIRTDETISAISRAEYIVGLEPTGHASEKLCEVLEHLVVHQGMILPIQIIFFDRGEIIEQPDGIFSRETRLAIERTEIAYGLTSPDGLPDNDVFRALIASLETRPVQDETFLKSTFASQRDDVRHDRSLFNDLPCNPIPFFDDFTDGS